MTIAIQENISLKEYSTFRIGGPARFFVVVKNRDELQEAIEFAESQQLEIFILGGGSNILINDSGFSGLVIKIEIKGIEIKDTHLIVGAGEIWDDVVKYSVEHNLQGLENLSWIPGTAGAAPVQNIGAYGSEIKDTLESVHVFDTHNKKIKIFKNSECEFAYRDSIFKRSKNRYVILSVTFNLQNASGNSNVNTNYKDISEYIKNNNITILELTPAKVRDIVIAIRTKKLPNIKEVGTAGSFFKNPVISQSHFDELKKKYPELVGYPDEKGSVKVSAAWILDNLCGFKGYRKGDAGVYKSQALVLVNFGTASFQEIHTLAGDMIAYVKEKTNIVLEKEVQII